MSDMPPWFADLMRQCEHLSLDSREDQERLWEILRPEIERRRDASRPVRDLHE